MAKKYYTFLNENEEVKAQVVAENHQEAIGKANARRNENDLITNETDFYSESYD